MDRDTLEAAAMVCETWAKKLSYGGGYALKIAAHEIRALAQQAGDGKRGYLGATVDGDIDDHDDPVPEQNAAPQVGVTHKSLSEASEPAVAAPLTMPEEENYTTCYGYAAALHKVAQEAIIQANEWKSDAARALKTADAEHIRANAAEAQVAALTEELRTSRREHGATLKTLDVARRASEEFASQAKALAAARSGKEGA